MRVCHRDLKLENFVLDKSQSTLKLIDFGLSVVWAEGQTLFKSYGTPCYTAPEIIGGKRYLGPQVDVWSLPDPNPNPNPIPTSGRRWTSGRSASR